MASNPSPYGGGSGTTGIVPPAGDIGGSTGTPTVTGEHFTAPLPIINGGSGQSTQQAAINALAGAVTNHSALAGDGVNMTARALVAADLPALNALTTPAAAVAFNNQKITGLANGSAATDGAAFGQIPLLSSTAGNFQSDGLATAGANGTGADSAHVHPEEGWQNLLLAPAGTLAETFPRNSWTIVSGALTSGTLFVSAIPLYKGLVVNNISFAFSGGGSSFTHGWFVLFTPDLVVRAVTADKTSGNWSTTALTTIAVGTPYTVATAGLFYIGVMVTAGGQPTVAIKTATFIQNNASVGAILGGSSGTGLTTPPSVGASVAAIVGNNPFYGTVS